MKDSTFYLANGQLNAYGLSCGYVEKHYAHGKWKQMYMEYNIFHVRSGKDGEAWDIWETFLSHELTKARKYYNSIKI